MKKSFLFLVAGLVISGSAMAQKNTKKTSKAVAPVATITAAPTVTTVAPDQEKKPETPAEPLTFKETTHDFGKIPQGKPVTTDFEIKNVGKDSLKLDMVQASCGCTSPIWKAGPYAPGETFKITVGYNAAAEGAFNKQVTITYNGGQQKVIFITGNVYSTPSAPAPQNGVGKIQD